MIYLCNPDSAKAVRAALRQPAARSVAERIDVHVTFGPQTAAWEGDQLPRWLNPLAFYGDSLPAVGGGIDPAAASGEVRGGER